MVSTSVSGSVEDLGLPRRPVTRHSVIIDGTAKITVAACATY